MIGPIQGSGGFSPIVPIRSLQPSASPQPAVAAKEKDFRSMLLDNLNEVNRLQSEADQGVQDLLTGETDDVGEVMVAINKAGIAFDLLMEVRNKVIDAYREIQEMRV